MWSMYWDPRNFWRASEENGRPLSEKNLFGGPYWEIQICNFLIMDSGCFGRCLVNEGIFTEGVPYEEILLVVECEEISC